MTAYYNENDPKTAAWLRELIKVGAIAPGDVDERSIVDVRPADLDRYSQCHFFAGIGGWSYALRLAGWPDDRPVWTGSCPCQPFSQAGRGLGTADARHLWPVWSNLIRECRPPAVFGEQVASPAALHWLAFVQDDMEGAGYAFAPFDLPAAGAGAPHIRQRIYFVADTNSETERRAQGQSVSGDSTEAFRSGQAQSGRCGGSLGLADSDGGHSSAEGLQRGGQHGQLAQDGGTGVGLGYASCAGSGRHAGTVPCSQGTAEGEMRRVSHESQSTGIVSELADVLCNGLQRSKSADAQSWGRRSTDSSGSRSIAFDLGDTSSARLPLGSLSVDGGRTVRIEGAAAGEAEPLRGFWSGADWIACRDGKWRPVEPGTFPLAHGFPCRVGLLRGYGNAISPEIAAEFIAAYLELRK